MKNRRAFIDTVRARRDVFDLLVEPFLVLDGEGMALFQNRTAERLFGGQERENRFGGIRMWIDVKEYRTIWHTFEQRSPVPFDDRVVAVTVIERSGEDPSIFLCPSYNKQGVLECALCLLSDQDSVQSSTKRMGLLKNIITDMRQSPQTSDSIFKLFVDHSLSGMIVVNQRKILFTNQAFKKITGYTDEEIDKMSPWDMVHPDEREKIRTIGLERLRKRDVSDYYETRWFHKEGYEIWVEVRAALIENEGEPLIFANVVDISNRKNIEKRLKEREHELQVRSIKLAETNTALKVLLEQRDEERIAIQKNFIFNVERLVLPYVAELEQTLTRPSDQAYIQTIKSNLVDMISPLLRKLADQYLSLTSKQIQIINLIRQGKLSKEIADIMGVSKSAIDFHRNEIRHKLGIKNKRINLRSYFEAMGNDFFKGASARPRVSPRKTEKQSSKE
jgi:PAS domain S-box-containing protein